MTLNVYWSNFEGYFPDLLWSEPAPLFHDLRKGLLDEYRLKHRLFKCPSFKSSLRNYFVIHSPIDFEVEWGDDGHIKGDINRLVDCSLRPYLQFFTEDAHIFLSDKPCELSVLPAFMHREMNFAGLTGRYDCGRWFRQVQATYFIEPNEAIKINKGDALFYIHFNTNEPVKFHRYRMNEQLRKEAARNGVIKTYRSFPTLRSLYEWYGTTRRLNWIKREIKANIC